METCSKCILPSDFPSIQFDEKSVCNKCNDYHSYHSHLGKSNLIKALELHDHKTKYDCIVPVSGGKDSMYILYYIVKELGLNPLAVNYNSGLQNVYANQNIANACAILNVDYVSVKSKLSDSLVRAILLIGFKQNIKPEIGMFCKNCETMLRSIAIRFAKQHKVKYIVWGSSALESGTNEQYITYKSSYIKSRNNILTTVFLPLIKKRTREFFSRKDRIFKSIRYINKFLLGWYIPIRLIPLAIKFNLLSIMQRFEMKVPFKYALRPHKVVPFTDENPKFIHFYDYIEWDSMNSISLLKEKLNWTHPFGKEDRFDCFYHGFPNYYSLKEFGISADGINYCNFIRENKLSKEEALKRENHIRESVIDECNYVIQKIGLKNYRISSLNS